MTGNNINVWWKILLESSDLRCLARRLAAYDGIQLRSYYRVHVRKALDRAIHNAGSHTWAIFFYDIAQRGSLDAVDDVVA